MRWHIALAQPGQDHIAAEALKGQRYIVYRPVMFGMVRHGRGRSRSVLKSMFPSYIFVIDGLAQGWESLRITPGIRFKNALLMMHGRIATVDDAIMAEIKAEEKRQCITPIANGKTVMPYKVGETVRIEEGPFCGLLGTIAALDDHGRVCLLLRILGRQSRVRVPYLSVASRSKAEYCT